MDPIGYRTIRANGIDFHVATAGTGQRLALCLHGFPESSYSWRYQMPLLAQLGYRAWAPDLRGYGASSRPKGIAAYALENLEEDVAALIEVSGATEVLLVGHDWGAVIAWYYAMFGRLKISKLIIMNVPHPALMEKGLRTRRQLAKSWYIFFFQLPWIPEWGLARRGCAAVGRVFRDMAVDKTRFPDEVLRVYREAAAAPGALTAMLNYYRALIRGLRRTRRRGIVPIDIAHAHDLGRGGRGARQGTDLRHGEVRRQSDAALPAQCLPLGAARSARDGELHDRGVAPGTSVPYAPGAGP